LSIHLHRFRIIKCDVLLFRLLLFIVHGVLKILFYFLFCNKRLPFLERSWIENNVYNIHSSQ